jgi:hypothetical protein
MKLQYPTYFKDINPNVHIRVLKKAIKVNGEIVEVNIINLFGFTLRSIVSFNGENTMFKNIQITLLKSWNKYFASESKL